MKGMSVLAAVVVVLMMHAREGTGIGVSPAVSCDPDCTGAADGDKVVNPSNCYEFYYCNGGAPVDYPSPCPDGNYFDSATGDCLPGSCESTCFESCDPDCTGAADGDTVVNPYNCNEFYYCIGGAPSDTPTPCPDGNYFDSATGDCLPGSCNSICYLSCDPDCTDAADGDTVVNPYNCSEFYYCIGGAPSDTPTPCPEGNYFDSATGDCLPGSCESICSSDFPQCPYTCTDYVEVIADAYDCSAYYICSSTGPLGPNYCDGERPYFNGTACVSDEGVCCTGYCDPYCDGSGFAIMPDPKDCEYFYICTSEEGVPGDDVHYSCDDGEYFDAQAGECVTGPAPDPCPTLCDAAGGLTL